MIIVSKSSAFRPYENETTGVFNFFVTSNRQKRKSPRAYNLLAKRDFDNEYLKFLNAGAVTKL